MFNRRDVIRWAASVAVLVTALGAAANARAENWKYRADLGGWLDVETGLVWGPYSGEWTNYGYNWLAADRVGVPDYQQRTGNSKWRLPTVAETQTAYAHHAVTYFAQTSAYAGACGWTSTAGDKQHKKEAWIMRSFYTGTTALISKESSVGFRPVYHQ